MTPFSSVLLSPLLFLFLSLHPAFYSSGHCTLRAEQFHFSIHVWTLKRARMMLHTAEQIDIHTITLFSLAWFGLRCAPLINLLSCPGDFHFFPSSLLWVEISRVKGARTNVQTYSTYRPRGIICRLAKLSSFFCLPKGSTYVSVCTDLSSSANWTLA